jgi:hypothetical protein
LKVGYFLTNFISFLAWCVCSHGRSEASEAIQSTF